MNPETKINNSVSTLVSFIKDNTKTNIVKYSRLKDLNLNDRELKQLLNVVENSIEQAFTNGYESVRKAVKEATGWEINKWMA